MTLHLSGVFSKHMYCILMKKIFEIITNVPCLRAQLNRTTRISSVSRTGVKANLFSPRCLTFVHHDEHREKITEHGKKSNVASRFPRDYSKMKSEKAASVLDYSEAGSRK